MSTEEAEVLVIGAGICGLATALSVARRGVKVRISERRSTLDQLVSGRPSINLTLGARGLAALGGLGLAERVTELSVTAKARHIHQRSGESTIQPYGDAGEAILSLRRNDLVGLLLDEVLAEERITMRCGERLLDAQPDGTAVVQQDESGSTRLRAEFIVGADGLNSAVRRAICKATGAHGAEPLKTTTRWLELKVPDSWPGSIPDAVDVWPQSPIMLIAFPNRNTVKTVLLFVTGGGTFPDYEQLQALAPQLRLSRDEYVASLRNHDEVRVVRCPVWHAGRLCVVGDAAHATAPYLGQGANAALADARELAALLHPSADWAEVGRRFESVRRPEMDCLARLTDQHYAELSLHMGDRTSALRHDLRALLGKYFTGQFQPIYNRVAFSVDSLQAAERDHAAEEPKLDAILDTVRRTVGQVKEK
ncbi:FAD-dependent oxidoreductase [Streptomyces sp. NPDC004752]